MLLKLKLLQNKLSNYYEAESGINFSPLLTVVEIMNTYFSESVEDDFYPSSLPLVHFRAGLKRIRGEDLDDCAPHDKHWTAALGECNELNELFFACLPFIDWDEPAAPDFPLALSALCAHFRFLWYLPVKLLFLYSVHARQRVTAAAPSATVARLDERSASVFEQLFSQLYHLGAAPLLQSDRAFRVRLRGEQVEGEVGPYMEVLSQVCEDVAAANLLCPTGNAAQAAAGVGLGEDRDALIPKPGRLVAGERQRLEFLGRLLGVATRSKLVLPLTLAPVCWRALCGERRMREEESLGALDLSFVESLKRLEAVEDREKWENIPWECVLSDGTVVRQLVPAETEADGDGDDEEGRDTEKGDDKEKEKEKEKENQEGAAENLLLDDTAAASAAAAAGAEPGKPRRTRVVRFEERAGYAQWCRRTRAGECDESLAALRLGLGSLVPLSALRVLSGPELEVIACGRRRIDVEVLMRHTRYRGGVAETDAHIVYFWNVLRSLSQKEREQFLRFAWGRTRLPSEVELEKEPLKIFPFPCRDPDQRLPKAETCFFTLKIPEYSSEEVLRERLMYAVEHTRSIDGDVQAQEDQRAAGTLRGIDIFNGLRTLGRLQQQTGGGGGGGDGAGSGGAGFRRIRLDQLDPQNGAALLAALLNQENMM